MELPVIIAITTGLVEMFKRIGLNSKYAPVASLFSSISLIALTGYKTMDIPTIIVTGVICGLSASGLYSGAKVLIKAGDK